MFVYKVKSRKICRIVFAVAVPIEPSSLCLLPAVCLARSPPNRWFGASIVQVTCALV